MSAETIGLSFDGFLPVGDALAVARRAAAEGIGSLWMADHLGYREAMTSCMAFAALLPQMRVVPTAISPYLHHPMPVAAALATLAEANGGRAALAIGTGNPMFLEESGLAVDKPLRAMREYAEALRALWSGAPVHQEGLLFQLRGARLAFQPPAPIPLYIAAMKEQMLRLTGRIADGVVLSAGLSADFARRSLDLVAEGAAAAGRPPEAVARAGYVYFLATRDTAAGVRTMKGRLAFLMRSRYIDDNLAHSGLPIDHAAIMDAVARRDFDTAVGLIPDEAVDAFSITGNPAQCLDGLARFRAAGLQDLVLVMAGTAEDRELGFSVIRDFSSAKG